jgi:2-phospho-L-lactate guanylyltransferase
VSGLPPTTVVVPVKPSGVALRRLAGVLDARTRRELQAAMLDDVLGACAAASGLIEVLVVTADTEAGARAAARGARVIPDHDPPRGMNAAVEIGLAEAARSGAEAALVLTADLPLASAGEIEAALAAAGPPGSVLLVPSRDGTGTNAMLLRPPTAMRPALGPDSRARHLARARRVGLRALTRELPGLALDIDTPADLLALMAASLPCATRTAFERARARPAAGSVL